MADNNQSRKEEFIDERTENVATTFGLEDHEATAADPRVNELKHAKSFSSRRPSMQPAKAPKPVDNPPVSNRPAATLPANVATNYGLEGHKADMNDPRIANMKKGRIQRMTSDMPTDEPATSKASAPPPAVPIVVTPTAPPATSKSSTPPPAATPPAAPVPVPLVVKQYDQPAEERPAPQPAPLPVAVPAPLPPPQQPVYRSAEPAKTEPNRHQVSKITNTDVTFDPSKVYASKTTNTPGNLYSDDEDNVPKHPPPPPPSLLVPNRLDLDDVYAFAVALVRKAGVYAQTANISRLSYKTKEHEKDLNTRVDMEVEAMMEKAITEKYPDHMIIAEEAVSASETGKVTLTDKPTWILDPIDGTMNYVHHFPYYCISLALFVDKECAFGIVYSPALLEFYTARKGQGAELNDEPIRTSGQESLKGAMVLQEYSSGMNEARTETSMENAKRLIKKTHALRSIGSSAMGLAMVASGVADAFYFFGLHVWDMAAGNLLVTEAGGTVIDPAGGNVDIMSRRVLAAATAPLALELSKNLVQNYPKPRDDEDRDTTEPQTKDFQAQTDFTSSSSSLDSDGSTLTAYHNAK